MGVCDTFFVVASPFEDLRGGVEYGACPSPHVSELVLVVFLALEEELFGDPEVDDFDIHVFAGNRSYGMDWRTCCGL